MKKLVILFLLAVLFFGLVGCSSFDDQDCFRIHIRANSNEQIDQNVKYMVKDAVVEFLTPLLADATDKNKAKQIVTANSEQICQVANKVLKQNGFDYLSSAKVTKEVFPTRAYGDFVLEQGEYDSLVLNLGSGSGDNWWCVVYPPLCFVGGEPTDNCLVYKSKLHEIIKNFFG
ncbi:MAG: stage II sporulation protein R [Clostridia bacterium]|nr:stage II sporulation protein R [Clostridia bacterium]